jgi:hypothetical protein
MNFIKNLINYSLIIIFSLFISKSLFAEEFGTKEEALALLDRAITLVKEDRNRALDLMTSGSGGLHVKDLYPFCMTDKGILLGHPTLKVEMYLNFQDSDWKRCGKVNELQLQNIMK